jgi:hypothetical protein
MDAWLLEERDRIDLVLEQLPREPKRDWEMLDRFFLEELERL